MNLLTIFVCTFVIIYNVTATAPSCKCVDGLQGRDGRDGMPGRDGKDCEFTPGVS